MGRAGEQGVLFDILLQQMGFTGTRLPMQDMNARLSNTLAV